MTLLLLTVTGLCGIALMCKGAYDAAHQEGVGGLLLFLAGMFTTLVSALLTNAVSP